MSCVFTYLTALKVGVGDLDLELVLSGVCDGLCKNKEEVSQMFYHGLLLYTYGVGNIVDLNLCLTHSLNNARVWLDYVAEGLSRANLIEDVLGWRVVLNIEEREVLANWECDLIWG